MCRKYSVRRVLISLFDKLGDLASEHAELEHALADPSVHADADQARTLAKRYAELTPIVSAYHEWQQTSDDEQAAREPGTCCGCTSASPSGTAGRPRSSTPP